MSLILVIEDQDDLRIHLVNLFRNCGYSVDGAADGQVAVELLYEQVYDPVLTDLPLGHQVDGPDLLDHVK